MNIDININGKIHTLWPKKCPAGSHLKSLGPFSSSIPKIIATAVEIYEILNNTQITTLLNNNTDVIYTTISLDNLLYRYKKTSTHSKYSMAKTHLTKTYTWLIILLLTNLTNWVDKLCFKNTSHSIRSISEK